MSQNLTKYLCQYFEEDLVYRTTPGGCLQVGVVLESNENSDSSDDEEEEDSTCKRLKLRPGSAKIAWYPKGSSQVVREKKVELFDRSLLTGDVVRRLNVDGGQRGYVCNSRVELVCRIVGTKQVIVGGQSKDFNHGIDLQHDVMFYYRNWLGIIEDIECRLILSLPDGSLVEVEDSMLTGLKDVTSERSRNCEFDDSGPYIGQQVVWPKNHLHWNLFKFVHKSEHFETFEFKKLKQVIVTVVQIQVERIQAHWMCCIAYDGVVSTENLVSTENIFISGDKLKEIVPLDFFKHGNVEMGDRGVYVLKENDSIMTYSEWSILAANQLRDRKLGFNLSPPSSNGREDDEEFVDVSSDERSVLELGSSLSLESDMRLKRKVGVAVKRIRRKMLRGSKSVNFSKKVNFSPGSEVPVEVIATRTFVEVIWQDGSKETDCPSTDFYPIHHLDGHEYFPGDFVVRSKDEFSHNLYGVIQSVDHSERTGRVRWLEVGVDQKPRFVSEEEVSVYDLEDHPDYVLRPGSVVARLVNAGTEKLKSAARAGQVVSLGLTGRIQCVWADGSRCEVDPQELYLVGDYDSDDLWDEEDDDDRADDFNSSIHPSRARSTPPSTLKRNTPPSTLKRNSPPSTLKRSSSSGTPKAGPLLTGKESDRELIDRLRRSVDGLEEWFTQFPTLNNHNGHVVVRKLTSLLENLEAVDGQMNTSLRTLKDVKELLVSVRLPESLAGHTAHINRRLNRLMETVLAASGGLQSGGQCPDEDEDLGLGEDAVVGTSATSSPISTKTKHSLEILHKLKTQLFAVCPENEVSSEKESVSGQRSGEKRRDSGQGQGLGGSFHQEDFVPDTHKFKLSLFQTSNPRVFFTRVRKEIDLLRSSLPKDILVKGFENRMDLFSVLIKGPRGTPYEDGLFLFDVQLPASYPNVPPLVHYIPFCRDRLNPNLYESGKVCVSLLGTWSGKGSEVWSPVDSTLLQLFISIQGLILVPEPYFNEAGYTRQKGTSTGDENSRLYNEMAVVKVVESMTRMVTSPPEPFRDEVISHVKSSSTSFIARLESWIRISRSGSGSETAGDFPLLPASKGFCLSLSSALQSFRSVLSKLE